MSLFHRSNALFRNPSFSGTLAGCSAHALWGFAVLYWHLLATLPAVTILAHRMLWSLLLLIGLLAVTRRMPELSAALHSRREAPRLALCAALLSVNWGFFLWGVNTGRVVEASLGYFITPLLNVLMGRFLLGERLSRAQTLAILLALAGVGWKIVVYGHVPWLALVVSVSFALYGFFQKTLRVGAAPGLTAELVFLAPFALAWLAWAHPHDFGALAGHGSSQPLLLAGTALFTAIPLQLFGYAAQRVTLATLGILQYVSPSLNFLLAVTLLGEHLERSDMMAFPLIWCALVIYTRDALQTLARMRREANARRAEREA